VIESMTGARFVHDTLEQEGWSVEIADAQKVKGLAPFLQDRQDRLAGPGRPLAARSGAGAGTTTPTQPSAPPPDPANEFAPTGQPQQRSAAPAPTPPPQKDSIGLVGNLLKLHQHKIAAAPEPERPPRAEPS
jgi:hypothetical protein